MISVDKKAKINNLKLLNHVQNQVSLSKAKIQNTWWPIFQDARVKQSEALMAKGGSHNSNVTTIFMSLNFVQFL